MQDNAQEIQQHIERLQREKTVALGQVKLLHEWLDLKRNARQCGRVTGESRTGKTKSCEAYINKNVDPQISGRTPVVPIGYVYPKPDCTSREFYRAVLAHYNFDLPRGTVGDIRSKTFEVIEASQTEMLIVDEADRLKPNTLRDVRDIFDDLKISVILVGTEKRIDKILSEDEQVENRFRPRYRIGTISSKDLPEIVGLWERDIIALPLPSNLTSKSALQLVRKAAGKVRKDPKTSKNVVGYYIGLLDMFLRECAIRSLKKGSLKIEMDVMQGVCEEYS